MAEEKLTEAELEEIRKVFRAKLKKYYEGHLPMYWDDDDDAEDALEKK